MCAIIAVVLLLPTATAFLAAQTNTGEIAGLVRDTQGGVLPGTAVIAQHVDSGAITERVTDAHGRYLLPSLRVGRYVITVELAGFRRIVRSGVIVQLGGTVAVDFTLEVGGPLEEVRVT